MAKSPSICRCSRRGIGAQSLRYEQLRPHYNTIKIRKVFRLTVDKGGSVVYNYVFKKSHALHVKLQCIREPYSKNVVNTFFWTNIAFPWVTTLQAISFKLLASCENLAIQYYTLAFKVWAYFPKGLPVVVVWNEGTKVCCLTRILVFI